MKRSNLLSILVENRSAYFNILNLFPHLNKYIYKATK